MELRKINISDIGKIITGKTPRTSITENYGGDIPFLTPSDDLTRKHVVKTGKTLSFKGLNEVKNCLIPEKSICVSCIGSDLGKVVMTNAPTVTNQQINSIIVNDEFDPDFIYYLMKIVGRELNFISKTSTAVPIINKSTFSNTEVFVPSLENQIRIGEILSSIDDKIELNRQINDNLEQQLKLLYRSWFIENKHPDSKEVCLSEIIYFQEGPGIRNWQYVEKDGIKFINIRCIEGGDINLTTANMISEEEANGKYAHFMLKPFDIIMSCSGTLGRYAIVRKEHLPLCLNTSVIRFSPNRSESDYSYIYGYLASEEFLNKQVEMACGSVQANFGPTHLKQIKIIAPPIDYCKSYHTAAMPIISKILENRREIQHLGKLRDTLLPKLMSGELKINEIDC